jgi:transcriptional regulator with XRE-family HTH domain
MNTDTGSPVPRWRLGRELARLREQSGLKTDRIAELTGCSRSKIYRIETGKSPVRGVDVEQLCKLYKAPARLTKALVALARETTKDGWWHAYGDVIPEWFDVFLGLEAFATRLDIYEPELMNGLLQTKKYARAVLATADPDGDEEELDRRVDLRMERQKLLSASDAPQLNVILNEAVLRRPVGGRAVMADQLRHLAAMSKRRNITVRVLPFSIGEHAAMFGGFTYMRFPDRAITDLVYHETRTGAVYLDKPAQRKPYRQMWRAIETHALGPDASRDMMVATAEEYES